MIFEIEGHWNVCVDTRVETRLKSIHYVGPLVKQVELAEDGFHSIGIEWGGDPSGITFGRCCTLRRRGPESGICCSCGGWCMGGMDGGVALEGPETALT